jgi:hypothetical protein
MNIELVVVRAFGIYRTGDRITDATVIAEILATENCVNVVKVPAALTVN